MEIQTLSLPEHPDLAARVAELAAEAERVDGVAPLSEQFLFGLTDARLGHRHLLALEDGAPAGVAALEGETAEMVVAPAFRRRGIGAALLRGLGDAEVWAHGDLPPARALAAADDRQVTRRLLVMAIEGRELAAAARYEGHDGVTVADLASSAERFGRLTVEQAWLKANNEAFSWHPEQGGWDLARLRRATEAEWFSEEDVLFLWTDRGSLAGADGDGVPPLAGFHWTKWHAGTTPPTGEVYVVGLGSGHRGQGLGDPLLRVGLRHLVGKGAHRVILYVEADNGPAVRVYEKLGFTIAEEHTIYARK